MYRLNVPKCNINMWLLTPTSSFKFQKQFFTRSVFIKFSCWLSLIPSCLVQIFIPFEIWHLHLTNTCPLWTRKLAVHEKSRSENLAAGVPRTSRWLKCRLALFARGVNIAAYTIWSYHCRSFLLEFYFDWELHCCACVWKGFAFMGAVLMTWGKRALAGCHLKAVCMRAGLVTWDSGGVTNLFNSAEWPKIGVY